MTPKERLAMLHTGDRMSIEDLIALRDEMKSIYYSTLLFGDVFKLVNDYAYNTAPKCNDRITWRKAEK